MRSVAVHGILAFVGLLLAYQAWTREEEEQEPSPGEVTLAKCELDQLASVEIENATNIVTAVPKKEGDDAYYWITSRTKPKEKADEAKEGSEAARKEDAVDGGVASDTGTSDKLAAKSDDAAGAHTAPDAGTAGASDAQPQKKPEKKVARLYDPDAPVVFVANEEFDKYLQELVPLRAVRALGPLAEDKLEEFGFKPDARTFYRLDCGGKKTELEIGGRTYGTNHHYARRVDTGDAYLVSGRLVNDFRAAQYKFMQKPHHRFKLSEVDEARVRMGDVERKLLHRNRATPKQARWVDAAEPDRRNELFNTWFQRVERLRTRQYLPEGGPGSDLQIEASEPEPVMQVEYFLEGKPQGKLELVRVDTEQGAFYYARSEATRFWVSEYDSLAKQVAEDVAEVVGAELASSAPAKAAVSGSDSPASPEHPHGSPSPQAPPKDSRPAASPHGPPAASPHGPAPSTPAAPHAARP